MINDQSFQIDDQEFHVRKLESEHLQSLQHLCERCADFVDLVEGTEVSPGAAEELFQDMPPGKSLSDKFLFGIFEREGEIVGVLEGMRHYPDESTWWIGLLMLAPEVRSRGLGRKVVDGFHDYVCSEGGMCIMLGVVEENLAAYKFWQQQGFTLVRQTEPRTFGKKVQSVYVMQRDIPSSRTHDT